MKTYHIIDKAEFLRLKDNFHPQNGAHYIELNDGKVLLCASFLDEGMEQRFHDEADKISLPHPVYEADVKLSDEHAHWVAHHPAIFPEHDTHEKRVVAAKQCTIRDIVKRASKVHALMKLHPF